MELLHEHQQSNRDKPAFLQGFQIHVAMFSTFPEDQIVFPTEVFLRKLFAPYGVINDVLIRQYVIHGVLYLFFAFLLMFL